MNHISNLARNRCAWTFAGSLGIMLAGCHETTALKIGPPARIAEVAAEPQTLTVGQAYVVHVRVEDQSKHPVPGITVFWAITTGGGTVGAKTSITNSSGDATNQWNLGTIAGFQSIDAGVDGLEGISLHVQVGPGPLANIRISRDSLILVAVGEVSTVSATPIDQYGNSTGNSVTWKSDDDAVATVAGGVITAHGHGITRIRASSGSVSGSVVVNVTASPITSPCEGISAPTNLQVGDTQTFTGPEASAICLNGSSASTDFVATLFQSPLYFTTLDVRVAATGAVLGSGLPVPVMGPASSIRLHAGSMNDGADQFEENLRRSAKIALSPLVAMARSAASQDRARFHGAVALQPGDLIQLNTNVDACTTSTPHTGRIVAITTSSVVVADTANPVNGFSDSDYQSFGAAFDTLVYPVDTDAFGAPTDIDGNQRVIIFFTRAVNELTPRNSSFIVGGFFHPRDLFPKSAGNGLLGCPTSNVAEMFYVAVPDPDGTINGNRRTLASVSRVTIAVLGHEFQHLINSSRRLYVNTRATWPEETWLDEGLAHIAEELVFYRASGLSPRRNIDATTLGSSSMVNSAVNTFQVSNLLRLSLYMNAVESYTPVPANPDNDDLQTRGATWAFLRYAADATRGTDGDIWQQLVNSLRVGLPNLFGVLPNVEELLRNFAVANYVDDAGTSAPASLSDLSWNFRSVLPLLSTNDGTFPLSVRSVTAQGQSINLVAGGAAYLRFGIGAGGSTGLRSVVGGAAPPASFSISVTRLR